MVETFAAVDLGSNSFHLLIARAEDGVLEPFERVKEKVQLARGQHDGVLTAQAIDRGLACVDRFAQRLRGIPKTCVRVVGTSALRESSNPEDFLPQARQLLDCPIRILTGHEEAELIFLGVSHTLASDTDDWLVIDVGGGSTEFALGHAFAPRSLGSVRLGCVSLTDRFFSDVPHSPDAFRAAREESARLLRPIHAQFDGFGGARVIDTSGTMESVCSVLGANGFTNGNITRDGLQRLERAILERRWMAEAGVPGLAPERADIFSAGLAAVCAIFEVWNLDSLEFVDATLQHGLLYDLTHRRSPEDVRELTIANWRSKFRVDTAQVARLERTALRLFDGMQPRWGLPEHNRNLLRWACSLHEIGAAISARHLNRHGAYLVENGDLIGFSHEDRRGMALLIRGHRGTFPMFAFSALAERVADALRQTTILLRLAVILERTRTDADSPIVAIDGDRDWLVLELPAGWLAEHALSRAELDLERERLAEVGIRLRVSEAP